MALSSLLRADRTLIRAIACSCGRHTLRRVIELPADRTADTTDDLQGARRGQSSEVDSGHSQRVVDTAIVEVGVERNVKAGRRGQSLSFACVNAHIRMNE
jgi:hypothetical protein